MKNRKRIVAITVVGFLLFTSAFGIYTNYEKKELSNIILANIETLSGNEFGQGEGVTYEDKVIYDKAVSVQVTEYGIITTFERLCAFGGSDYCTTGEWTHFMPRF